MRVLTAFIAVMLTAGTVAGQGRAQELRPYGLDPYKPSDAALLRNYGAALVAQTPLLQLMELDPYKPSHADLLRQVGGAMPLWSHFSWYPNTPAPAPLMVPTNGTVAATGPGSVRDLRPFAASAPRRGRSTAAVPCTPAAATRAARRARHVDPARSGAVVRPSLFYASHAIRTLTDASCPLGRVPRA